MSNNKNHNRNNKNQVKRNVKAHRQAEQLANTTVSISKSIPFIGFSSTSSPSYVYSPGANVTFELSQCSEYTSFSALYDEAKITHVNLCFTWLPEQSSAYDNTCAIMYYAPDRDGGTVPASFDEIQQRAAVTRVPLRFTEAKIVWYKNQQAAYSDSDGRIVTSNRWFDLAEMSNITFCVGTTGMLKRAASPSGIDDRVCLNIRPHIVFRRRR